MMNGTYDDHGDYHPHNNFSFFANDAPDGVIPKYRSIQQPGIATLLNGIPEKPQILTQETPWISSAMIVQALIGSLLHGYSIRVIYKNENLSWTVKWFLIADAFTRFNDSFRYFFAGYCAFNWFCVNPKGYRETPIPWFLVNQIYHCFNIGIKISGELLASGLTVFFDGLYYRYAEKLALPHICLSFVLPIANFMEGIGSEYKSDWKTTIYYGHFFTPALYLGQKSYNKDAYGAWMGATLSYILYGILAFTSTLDLLTLWRIRQMKATANHANKKIELRLSIMILSTHLITLTTEGLNSLFTGADISSPVAIYLVDILVPYFCRNLAGMVIILFMATPKSSQNTSPVMKASSTEPPST